MAIAVFKLVKCTGSSAATEADATGNLFSFLNTDINSLLVATYPVPIPADGGASPKYSYENWLRLECTSVPDNQCNNFKFWGSASPVETGKITVNAGTTGTGVTPTDAASSVATTQQDTNYTGSGNGLSIGVVPGDNIINAISEQTDYLVVQMKVIDGASSGEMTEQVYQWGYDES